MNKIETYTREELEAIRGQDVIAWAVVQREIKRGEAVIIETPGGKQYGKAEPAQTA